jgi:hypothetical protein
MSDSKVFMFPENGYNNNGGFGLGGWGGGVLGFILGILLGNNGLFGGGDSWLGILFLIALCNGGFGFGGGFGGGYGNMMLGYDFPWLLNGQNGINANVNGGFRDAQLHDSITSTRDAISALATQLCQCCADMRYEVSNGLNGVNQNVSQVGTNIMQQMSANEMASLNRSFAEQAANQQGFNGVMSGIADLRYTEATEGCATRTAAAQNTRDIVDAIRSGDQMIMDKLCALELDGVKNQLAQAQRDNIGLQNAVNMATMQANSLATADNIVDNLYNRLKNCPVNTTPVYGNQPIFTCPQNINSGCGCGSF